MGYIELCIHTKVRDASISIMRCACGKARKDELLGGYLTRGVSSSGDAVACADQPARQRGAWFVETRIHSIRRLSFVEQMNGIWCHFMHRGSHSGEERLPGVGI